MKFKVFHFLYLFTIFNVLQSYSQGTIVNFVTYKVDRYLFENEKERSDDEQLKAFRSIEYQLLYNNSRSIYQPVEKLYEGDNMELYDFAKMMAGTYFFKDILTKEKIELSDAGGEMFYVFKKYDEYKWEITNETKIIDGYKCIKAMSYKEEISPVRNTRRKFYPTVWFAPEIPAPFGPYGLDGLPGLVLEATYNGKIYFYATKIDFNSSSEIVLEKPSKGKFVQEDEFLKIVNDVTQKLLFGGQ